MVVIEGKTAEEWWSRSPEDQFCENLDRLIYFHRFWIDLEWLWSHPLPADFACLTRIPGA